MSFAILPAELHLLISTYLPPHALYSLILTSRLYYTLYLPQLHIQAHDPKGNLPALHWSILRNYPPLTTQLLTTKPTLINTPTADGWTALHYAAAQGLASTISLLLSHGADPNKCDFVGAAPLDHAPSFASFNRFSILSRFPSHQPCGDRKPVSRWHVWRGEAAYDEVARLLLAAGANVNNQDRFGRTALFWAARVGALSIVRVLMEAGADVNLATRDGETPLMAVVSGFSNGMEEDKRLIIVEMLLDKGADFHATNGAGQQVMYIAVMRGARRTVRMLADASRSGAEEWMDEGGRYVF